MTREEREERVRRLREERRRRTAGWQEGPGVDPAWLTDRVGAGGEVEEEAADDQRRA